MIDRQCEFFTLFNFWPGTLPLFLVLLAMAGYLGRGIGLPFLFRDDDQLFNHSQSWGEQVARPGRFARFPASPAFWTGFAFILAVGLLWIDVIGNCAARAEIDPAEFAFMRGSPVYRHLLTVLMLALLLLLLANWRQLLRRRADFEIMDAKHQILELCRVSFGAALGMAVVLLGLLLAQSLFALTRDASDVSRYLATHSFALPQIAFIIFMLMRQSAFPCVSLFGLIMVPSLIAVLWPADWREWHGLAVVLVIALVVLLNGRPGKFSITGFAAAVPGIEPNPEDSKNAGPQAELLKPVAALEAWKKPGDKPILVLVATSGGAYRAGFWTSLILDHLVQGSAPHGRWPGLGDNIRLFTGASGGMVGAAYFVAMSAGGKVPTGITRQICEDTRLSLEQGEGRKWPISRDSLSPVVHQLVRRDLPLTFWPRQPTTERGRKLEEQWRSLDVSFESLIAQERAGSVPSMILAPMLIESGAVALFSNLNLSELRSLSVLGSDDGDKKKNRTSVEILSTFKGAHEQVSLATAVRLNATFPYVSPAISLPCWPERRPVDAGYYDNYGVDLLTAYLDVPEISKWIKENCAAVTILQIRAFPASTPTQPASRFARATQFLSSPPEGLFTARKASQMFRNDQQLVATADRYNAGRPGFLNVFTFEANTDVSLSWYMRCDEMRALSGLLAPPRTGELAWEDPAKTGDEVDRAAVEAWSLARFGGQEQLIAALQRDDPDARWAQYLHHRAKVAAEFARLEAFWTSALLAQPD